MAFTPGISDILKIFELANHRKEARKESVIEWLSAVHKDLDDLAKAWVTIYEAAENSDTYADGMDKAGVILRREPSHMSQWLYAGRLSEFYQAASTVLDSKGDKAIEFHKDFIRQLANVLTIRNRARTLLDKSQSPIDGGVARLLNLSGSSQLDSGTSLKAQLGEQVILLQKEIAKIQVLIETYKANG